MSGGRAMTRYRVTITGPVRFGEALARPGDIVEVDGKLLAELVAAGCADPGTAQDVPP